MALRALWFLIGGLVEFALVGVLVGHYEIVAGCGAFTVVLVGLDVAFSGARKRQSQSLDALSGMFASAQRKTTEGRDGG